MMTGTSITEPTRSLKVGERRRIIIAARPAQSVGCRQTSSLIGYRRRFHSCTRAGASSQQCLRQPVDERRRRCGCGIRQAGKCGRAKSRGSRHSRRGRLGFDFCELCLEPLYQNLKILKCFHFLMKILFYFHFLII